MISTEKNFLFIHIPKTGGNSLQNILSSYSNDKIVTCGKHQDGVERFGVINDKYKTNKHSTLSYYRKSLDRKTFNNLYKFSVLRNPWDRCVSSFFSPHRGETDWNRDKFKAFIYTIRTTKDYIRIDTISEKIERKLNIKLHRHTEPIDRDIDFLVRFENLNEDFKKVCKAIDIPIQELPHRNKSHRKHYSTYYDDELIEIVREKFSEEINFGNYVF